MSNIILVRTARPVPTTDARPRRFADDGRLPAREPLPAAVWWGQITPPSSPMPTDPFSEGNTPNLAGPLPRTSAAAARQLTLPKRGGARRLAAPRNSPGLASCSSGHAQGFVIQLSPAWRRCGLVNQRCLVNYQKIAGQRSSSLRRKLLYLGRRFVFDYRSSS